MVLVERERPEPLGRPTPAPDLALGVVRCALEFDEHGRFIAHHPSVVAGCDPVDVARLRLALRAVAVCDVQPAGHHVANVLNLAAFRAHDGLDALRPAPAGLECVATDLTASEVHQLDRRV